ncbi:MAG: type II toxin-antitoxin system HicA family toxin [Deltaproteobacteria bacterium]|nr:type II toxin-antitoxin system HicA family toxin [Deltaproteobacteria bacterium]
MPEVGPIKRRQLISALKRAGFEGPYSGGKHQFMTRDNLRIRIPNPHKEDIGKNLLSRILSEAGISRETWEKL